MSITKALEDSGDSVFEARFLSIALSDDYRRVLAEIFSVCYSLNIQKTNQGSVWMIYTESWFCVSIGSNLLGQFSSYTFSFQ